MGTACPGVAIFGHVTQTVAVQADEACFRTGEEGGDEYKKEYETEEDPILIME
jgi:hypothetical protein